MHFCQWDLDLFKLTALVETGKCYEDYKIIFISMELVGESNNKLYLKQARNVLLGVA